MAHYQPGESGNPAGQPPGVGRAAELRRMLLSRAPEVIEALITRATKGDVGAMKVIVDRLIPPVRAITAPVSLPRADGGNPGAQAEIVIGHLLSGGLPPDIASQIMQSLQAHYQMTLLQDIEKRLAALESTNGNNPAANDPAG